MSQTWGSVLESEPLRTKVALIKSETPEGEVRLVRTQ